MLDDSVDLVLALDYIINLAEPHARRLNKVDPYRSCKSFIINKNRQILFSAAEEKSDQNNRPTNSSIVSVCVRLNLDQNLSLELLLVQGVFIKLSVRHIYAQKQSNSEIMHKMNVSLWENHIAQTFIP